MHESKVGKSWLDEVIREAVRQALEVAMETEREAFLAEQGGEERTLPVRPGHPAGAAPPLGSQGPGRPLPHRALRFLPALDGGHRSPCPGYVRCGGLHAQGGRGSWAPAGGDLQREHHQPCGRGGTAQAGGF